MNSKIEIKYGDWDLLLSGVFLTSADKEIQINLFYNNDTIKFVLVFDNSDPSKELSNKGEVIGTNTLRVTFFNHTDSLGSHTTQPLYVGGIGNRKLYWLYRVTQLSKSPKTPNIEPLLEITYSFYLGSEGPLGTN